MSASKTDILLEVRNLETRFETDEGTVTAVDGASWFVRRGETLALVGESGCGKSATALSILRLIPNPPGKIAGGEIRFADGPSGRSQDLLTLPEDAMRRVRGNRIAMIFQEPMSALNPVLTIGYQIAEAVELHQNAKRREALAVAVNMLGKVGIPAPEQRIRDYPHQLSGGMQQRVMIAMALSCNPALLIADEPTTALDVTVQAQILDVLRDMQAATGMSIVFITHDLGVVAQIADRVCVMYAGKVVESAPVEGIFAHPAHPYTQGLLRSLPRMGPRRRRLDVIRGSVPDPIDFPEGCRFHPRCDLTRQRATNGSRRSHRAPDESESLDVLARCVHHHADEPGGTPQLREVRPGHSAACWEADGYTATSTGDESA